MSLFRLVGNGGACARSSDKIICICWGDVTSRGMSGSVRLAEGDEIDKIIREMVKLGECRHVYRRKLI